MTEPLPPKACPICGKPADPELRPFCSRRCANVDLHRWLSGSYVLPAVAEGEGDDDYGDGIINAPAPPLSPRDHES